jgi:hypothetical protein
MSGPNRLIADGLRELADQAAVPSNMAHAAWHAGRRRRLAARASVAAAAAAVVLAVLLPLAIAGGPAHPRQALPGVSPAAPINLRSPIQFQQVATITRAPCAARSTGLAASNPPACFHLTGARMTLTRVESARVGRAGPAQYSLSLVLTPADGNRFAALTGPLVGQPSPRDELATIIGGRVIAHPVVVGAIHGQVQIGGLESRAQAEQLLHFLRK